MGAKRRAARVMFLSHLDRNLYQFRLPIMKVLASAGHEVIAACPSGRWARRFAEFGVRHVDAPFNRIGMNPVRESATVARLIGLMRTERPDLLHTFMMKPNIYGLPAAMLAGIPARVASVTGLGSYYVVPPRGFKCRGLRAVMDAAYRRALHTAHAVIFYNRDDLAEFENLRIMPAGRGVIVNGSGVDAARFAPPVRTDNGTSAVVMIARLIRDKGVEEFLTAAERLKPRYGRGVVFRLIGEPDPGNPTSADMIRIGNLSRRGIIEWPGVLDDVRDALRDAAVYVLPSYREGMPVSILEAQSMGIPVVTTDVPGCRQSIVGGQTGKLVPPRDAAALADAIVSLLDAPEKRMEMGAAARQRVLDLFAIEKIVAAHLYLYSEVLGLSNSDARIAA